MKTKILNFLFITTSSLVATAQSTVLDSYLQQGLRNNLQLKQEQLNYERSVETLAQARALFLPYVLPMAHTNWLTEDVKYQFQLVICEPGLCEP